MKRDFRTIFRPLLCGALVALLFACGAKRSTVAVVVDEQTYAAIGSAVDKYVEAISRPDREGVLVVDKWQHPDSIRAELYKMYCNDALEGAVFVGEIPIPMIRDAQHMATAFKRSQEDEWIVSSIPSDRFYDDFDLKFDYLKQDSLKSLAHYYSLSADSPQQLSSDIYSARIKAPADGNEHKAIEAYLLKAVEAHKNPERMDKVLHFGAHGYNSESLQARIDEAIGFKEQFPFLNGYDGELTYIDFNRDYLVKERIMNAVADEDVDYAIMHHHGLPYQQLLQGVPKSNSLDIWKELSSNNLRNKVRSAVEGGSSAQTAIAKLVKRYDVPASWMAGWNDPELIRKDSIFDADKNIMLEDLYDYKSGARVLVLDACYNGAFIEDDFIAARYIFNEGSTMVVRANSVNTLQDIWTVELSGLLNLGVCVGDVYKGQLAIEQHLFGDPTFAFAPQSEVLGGYDIARDIVFKKNDVGYWRGILENSSKDLAPELRVLAVKMLHKNGAISSKELLDIAKKSPYHNVRMEAFVTNREIADENFTEALKVALEDSYEIVRRIAMGTAPKNGNPELIPYVAKAIVDPAVSKREDMQADFAMPDFDAQLMIAAIDSLRKEHAGWFTDAKFEDICDDIRYDAERKSKEYADMLAGNYSESKKIFYIEIERNKCSVDALGVLYDMIANGPEKEKVVAAEILGWYVYSYRKPEILAKVKEFYANASEEAVKNELLKTINRLECKRS